MGQTLPNSPIITPVHHPSPSFILPSSPTSNITPSEPKPEQPQMGREPTRTAILLGVLLLVSLLSSASAGTVHGWMSAMSGLEDGVGEWISQDEFAVDSEVSRRILATSNYISYQSLKRGTTPCSVKGASYYNCRPGAQANPYSRGCSSIARCRS